MIGLVVDGLSQGVVFAMLGLTITLVFGLGGVLNLATGVFGVIGVIIAARVTGIVQSPYVALVVGSMGVGALGLGVDQSLLRFVYRADEEDRVMLGIFVTLGLATFLEGLFVLFYPNPYSVPPGLETFTIEGVFIRGASVATIVVGALVFAALYLFMTHTFLGQATRTVMQDETGALLCGINTRRLRTLTFVLSTVLAAIAAIAFTFSSEIAVGSSFRLTTNAVIVAIVGGVTNLTRTVIAGIGLGIITTFASGFFGGYFSQLVLFLTAIVVLLAKSGDLA